MPSPTGSPSDCSTSSTSSTPGSPTPPADPTGEEQRGTDEDLDEVRGPGEEEEEPEHELGDPAWPRRQARTASASVATTQVARPRTRTKEASHTPAGTRVARASAAGSLLGSPPPMTVPRWRQAPTRRKTPRATTRWCWREASPHHHRPPSAPAVPLT